ncbi:helix-turn-helix transcriptional regulator [Oceanicola sp. 502str15]|uniref:ArsR/SmtB family transcription factor n=1 Tax=Oceanicola sp. 502str15 TaxID=2696061 RepID=UPI002095AAD5|nr:metalloregulator ArsR/SmtB family transcription factor [Oceanicola sp. 502str15]MCO6382379.1 metalloregulator ArsR/SmtB family transcription factor [Oceanicola sp. 502str15]
MADSLSRCFSALADPTRRAIIGQLVDGPATVGEIVARHDMSQPAISKHLKVLEAAGLIERTQKGQTRPCSLRPEGMQLVAAWVGAYRGFWGGSFERIEALVEAVRRGEVGQD